VGTPRVARQCANDGVKWVYCNFINSYNGVARVLASQERRFGGAVVFEPRAVVPLRRPHHRRFARRYHGALHGRAKHRLYLQYLGLEGQGAQDYRRQCTRVFVATSAAAADVVVRAWCAANSKLKAHGDAAPLPCFAFAQQLQHPQAALHACSTFDGPATHRVQVQGSSRRERPRRESTRCYCSLKGQQSKDLGMRYWIDVFYLEEFGFL